MITETPVTEAVVYQALKQVIDPELGCNLVDLGLIYSVRIEGPKVTVVMTLTTPGCPMHESLSWGVKCALLSLEGVDDAGVEVVWDPPWHPSMMTDAGRAATGAGSF
ncbi:MAG TPA: metal-sulfur cluster assembly factor [Verrucomicrobiae bacterium]|jgi:metal-sulfur cluster biosynthetic enzyme|nr:metal-sulfur cluster assembly factor [Verrucomicrobiae bacterium]